MTIIPVEEFQWNLKRLLREGFPQGIPLERLSTTYTHWLGNEVQPNSIGTGFRNWKMAFRVNNLLKETFKITADKIPMVKLRIGGNERSSEELKEVLELVKYANVVMIRVMKSYSTEGLNSIDNKDSATTGAGNATGITSNGTMINGIGNGPAYTTDMPPINSVQSTEQVHPVHQSTGDITVPANDLEHVNENSNIAGANVCPEPLMVKITRRGKSFPPVPGVLTSPPGESNPNRTTPSTSKGGKRRIPEDQDNSNNKIGRITKVSSASPLQLPHTDVIQQRSVNETSGSVSLSNEQPRDNNIPQNENELDSTNVTTPAENSIESSPGPSACLNPKSGKNQEWVNTFFSEVCDVCRFSGWIRGNEMITCISCKMSVHRLCYGIDSIPSEDWTCQSCLSSFEPICILCPNVGGAMKPILPGYDWAHLICATWIPEVKIECVKKMEPITNISNVSPERWHTVCSLCNVMKGVCIQCSVRSMCNASYHVTCAVKHGLEMKSDVFGNVGQEVSLISYCREHSSTNYRAVDPFRNFYNPGERVELPTNCLKDKILVYPRFQNRKKYLYGYHSQLQKTISFLEVIPPRKSSALIFHENKIYDIGGTTHIDNEWNAEADASQSVNIFTAGGQAEIPHSLKLVEPRKEFSVCVCGDYMYAIGGFRGKRPIHLAERLQLNRIPEGNSPNWETIRNMKLPRAGHDVAVLENMIYVIGGIGPVERGCQSVDCCSAMQYDTIKNTWTWVLPMSESRRYVKAAVMNKLIYAVGGDRGDVIENASKDQSLMFGNRTNLNSVEIYSPERNTWSECTDMNRPRSRGAVTVQGDLLYAIGGDSRVEPTVEVYDSRVNKWMLLDWPVNLFKDADLLTAIVIDI